jgi:hypothetical protein
VAIHRLGVGRQHLDVAVVDVLDDAEALVSIGTKAMVAPIVLRAAFERTIFAGCGGRGGFLGVGKAGIEIIRPSRAVSCFALLFAFFALFLTTAL